MKLIVDDVTDDLVTLRFPGTNYRSTFKYGGPIALQTGQRLSGEIHAPARKAEPVSDGGNYVEPLFGRPRRMQGRVVEQNVKRNELLVQTGYPVRVTLPPGQTVTEFPIGSRVGWDNADWPTLEVATTEKAISTAALVTPA